MGFDTPGESNWIIPVSDTQAYRQFGNAVAPPVVEAIVRHMKPHLMDVIAKSPVAPDESDQLELIAA